MHHATRIPTTLLVTACALAAVTQIAVAAAAATAPAVPATAGVAPTVAPAASAIKPAAPTPQRAAPAMLPAATAVNPAVKPNSHTVVLDVGHRPGEGSRSASGLAEHNFNLRFASVLEAQLRARGIAVHRLPTRLSLADRAERAGRVAGAGLLVSIHHDTARAPAARPAGMGSAASAAAGRTTGNTSGGTPGGGYTLTIGHAAAMPCARLVAAQLQDSGRHFATAPGTPWVDKGLGVRGRADGALLPTAPMPALKLSLADIGNPAEERLAGNAAWTQRQAIAVARGLVQCLGPAPAVPAMLPAQHVPSGPTLPGSRRV